MIPHWVSQQGALNAAGFYAPLKSYLTLIQGVGLPTFTRATTAVVVDQDGVQRTVLSGEARFTGARRVQNTVGVNSENNTVATLLTSANATVAATTVSLNSANASYWYIGSNKSFAVGATVVTRVVLISPTNITVCVRAAGAAAALVGANTTVNVNLVAGIPAVVSVSGTVQTSAQIVGVGIENRAAVGATNTGTFTITATQWQIEDTTSQTNQNPAEYVSNGVLAAPYHGAGVDGVQYFEYLNGNTVSSNVVTAGFGAPIADATLKGYVREPTVTNSFLNSGAPVTQTISLGVGTFTTWLTGTGSVTTSAGTATATGYGAATSAAPNTIVVTVAGTVVFTVAGTVTFTQVENNPFSTSPIATAGTAVTRNTDVLTYSSTGNALASIGTMYAETFPINVANLLGIVSVDAGSTTNMAAMFINTNAALRQQVLSGGVTQADIQVSTLTVNAINKCAAYWNTNAFNAVAKGVLGTAVTTGTPPASVTEIRIGAYGDGTLPMAGNIRNVRIWQTQLPNSVLQAITT